MSADPTLLALVEDEEKRKHPKGDRRSRGDAWDGKTYGNGAGQAKHCVRFTACTHCGAKPRELCNGKNGKTFDVHNVRRDAYQIAKMKARIALGAK